MKIKTFLSRLTCDSTATPAGWGVKCGVLWMSVRLVGTRATAGMMTERMGVV